MSKPEFLKLNDEQVRARKRRNVAIALGLAVITIHPPIVLFAIFVIYGTSGYGVYIWKRLKGKPVSVISTSNDEPDEAGLHR